MKVLFTISVCFQLMSFMYNDLIISIVHDWQRKNVQHTRDQTESVELCNIVLPLRKLMRYFINQGRIVTWYSRFLFLLEIEENRKPHRMLRSRKKKKHVWYYFFNIYIFDKMDFFENSIILKRKFLYKIDMHALRYTCFLVKQNQCFYRFQS